ncbi:MAG: cation diffusion facilitator family transporter [Gemmatimonadaceae bacterium]
MSVGQAFEFPKELEPDRRRIKRLAWLSIFGLASAAVALGLTLGQSQTMKTAWVGDMLAIIPPMGSLVAMRYEFRPPTARFPFGYFRAIAVAFLVAAAVLSLIGLWLFYDALMKLVSREHPSIGTMELFGRQFWAGWAMIAALAYSSIVGFTLGALKRPIAKKLHDKALEADADSNKADWMSEAAGIVGIVLVGFGFWWGDPVAAGLISLTIVHDGWLNLRQVIADLMDETPTELGSHDDHESLPRKLKDAAERLDWVEKAAVRLREHGRVLTGDVFVVPRSEENLVARAEQAAADLQKLDWRLHDLNVTPVSRLRDQPPPASGEG